MIRSPRIPRTVPVATLPVAWALAACLASGVPAAEGAARQDALADLQPAGAAAQGEPGPGLDPEGASDPERAERRAPARKVEIPVQPGPRVPDSASAPPAPTDPAARELARALREAKAELEAVLGEQARDADGLGVQVTALEEGNRALRDEGRSLEARLRALDKEIADLDRDVASGTDARSKAEENLRVTLGEHQSQVAGVIDRFRGSILAAEQPDLIETAEALKGATAESLPDDVERLFGLYRKILDASRTAGVLEARVQLPSQGGKLERVTVLRMGLLAGYYAQSGGAEVGFVLANAEGGGALRGEPRGITSAQAAEIRAAIGDPSRGGLLPADVTGGAGVAALQTRQSIARWFEAGGFAMWPLLAIFITAVLLIVERAVVLTIKSAGIRRRTGKVLALVRSGRSEDAEDLCVQMGGPVGGVLHAALVHRGKGRAVMEDAVQEALLHNAPAFQTRLGFIALCAAVAPLLGLFGTVTGMITTFKMVTLFGTSDPRFLAGGISEALITTETGLMIAIPSLLMRGVLGAVAESALGRLEAGALSVVIELVKAEEAAVEVKEAA